MRTRMTRRTTVRVRLPPLDERPESRIGHPQAQARTNLLVGTSAPASGTFPGAFPNGVTLTEHYPALHVAKCAGTRGGRRRQGHDRSDETHGLRIRTPTQQYGALMRGSGRACATTTRSTAGMPSAGAADRRFAADRNRGLRAVHRRHPGPDAMFAALPAASDATVCGVCGWVAAA
jgi:hypothetical protein